MTSFGIEWETQAHIIYKPKYKDQAGNILWSETVINNSKNKWNIACEIWDELENNKGRRSNLCTHNLEVRIGEFYGSETKFNTDDFVKSCDNFMTYWKDVIKNKKITIGEKDYDLFTVVRNPSDKTGDTYYKTCKSLEEGKNMDKYKKIEWAYTKNLQLAGVPQITIGVNLKYVFNLFKFIYDKLKNPATKVENIRAYYNLKNISYAFIDTINDIHDNDPVDVIIFILLCNNHVISMNKKVKYTKAGYLFKVRTNLGNMYASLSTSSKIRIAEWMQAKLKSTLTDNQKDVLESIFTRQTGYVLQNSDQFNKVGLNNLTILPFETINLKSFEHEDKDKFFKKIMYSATSKKQDWDYNSLKYNKKTNSIIRWSVPMDFGEWIYTNNTVHIELRAVVPILQLLKPYDKKPFSNNIRESLCGDVTLLLDTLSNEMQNDFPDKNQIKLLKAQTKEEYKIYEEFKKQNVKESEEQKVNQSEEQTVSLPDEYGSESDLESDSDFEYESESDD